MWRRCSTGGGSCRRSSSSNFNMRSFGERVALNMPIQGTAADIMKLAMVAVEKAAEKGAAGGQAGLAGSR